MYSYKTGSYIQTNGAPLLWDIYNFLYIYYRTENNWILKKSKETFSKTIIFSYGIIGNNGFLQQDTIKIEKNQIL